MLTGCCIVVKRIVAVKKLTILEISGLVGFQEKECNVGDRECG